MDNTVNNHEKTAHRCALISLGFLLVAAAFDGILFVTDGSIPKDWITDIDFLYGLNIY